MADALKKENAQLLQDINAIKDKLGIAIHTDDEERARIKELFDLFDKDGSGGIDREEFELLAYECGADVSQLSPENIDKSFKALDTSGDGVIQFNEFLIWMQSDREQPAQKDTNATYLRLRLQSKAFAKKFEIAKYHLEKPVAAGKEEKKANSAPAAAAGKRTQASNVSVSVGDFKEAGASIIMRAYDSAKEADEHKEQVDCPEEIDTFLCIDFSLQKGADDMLLGELCGMVEMVLNASPLEQLPFYHSHTVDIWQDPEDEEQQALRLTVFSSINPLAMVSNMAVGQGDAAAQETVKTIATSNIGLEVPFSFDAFLKDPNRPLTADQLKARFYAKYEADQALVERSENMLERLPPVLQKQMKLKLASLKFFQGLDMTLKFADIEEFVSHLREVPPNGPLHGLKATVEDLGKMAIGKSLQKLAENIIPFAESQRDLYNAVTSTCLGLSSVRVFMGTYVIRLDFKGLDFVPFLPKLPNPQ